MAKEVHLDASNIVVGELVYKGQKSTIDAVTLTVLGEMIKLLRKKFNGYPVEFMHGPNLHTELQGKGYPVLSTWWYDPGNEVEYITDLRREGTHRVIDFCSHSCNLDNLYVSNLAELESDINDLVIKSADDGYIINEPNIFFDIEISTGIAKVVLGDLRELGYEPFYDGEPASRDEILVHNKAMFKSHLDKLKEIILK